MICSNDYPPYQRSNMIHDYHDYRSVHNIKVKICVLFQQKSQHFGRKPMNMIALGFNPALCTNLNGPGFDSMSRRRMCIWFSDHAYFRRFSPGPPVSPLSSNPRILKMHLNTGIRLVFRRML